MISAILLAAGQSKRMNGENKLTKNLHGIPIIKKSVENITTVHDLHATILHLVGLDHQKLIYRFGGRDVSLTDVHGRVVHEILT